MNFVESLELFHVSAKEIPCLTGSGAPTGGTEGAPGVLYMDIDTGDLYKCRGGANGRYRWEMQGGNCTEADKAEMVAMVIDALSGKVISGYVDSDNNIVINNLPDGSYTVKYEMGDGSTLKIGDLVLGSTGPSYTNLAEPNTDNTTDWDIWCNDARIGSDGAYRQQAGYVVTNWLEANQGDVFLIDGLMVEESGNYPSVGTYNSNKEKMNVQFKEYITANQDATYTKVSDSRFSLTFHNTAISYPMYFRVCAKPVTGTMDVIITKNEEID